jgi:hypothetical protein
MSLSAMRRINIHHGLHSPSKEQLTTLLSTLCSDGRLWKLGSCFEDLLDGRPFSVTHYNSTRFDTVDAMCVAYGITTKELAAALETAGLRHLKHTLLVGVNIKDQDDVPHDAITAAHPQALYIVPVVRTITTQAQFKAEHLSEYKLKNLGVPTLMEQRVAQGLPPHKPHKPHILKVKHDGGKQPKKQVHMDDDDFVSGLIHSGIPLAQLDSAFTGTSCSRLNKLLAIFWKVPEVARELSLLFGGTQIADAKFKRIKPIFERARKSGASCSSAPLPLDATEPRLELELASADNFMAIA